MSALMNKVWNFFGMDTPESDMDLDGDDMYNQPYSQNYGQDEIEENDIEDKRSFGRKNGTNNKVVSMPQQGGQAIKMVISQPTTFEQSDEICAFLKERKSIIVNLEYVNKDVARRIVDFISGGVYALDGYIQKVSNSIFLVAPSNYEITNEMAREEMKNKLSVSWLKNNNLNSFELLEVNVMITPLDIENKKFAKQMMNGYSVEEVDDFLDELTVDYSKNYKELTELRSKIDELNNSLAHYKSIESTLQSTLVMAQTTAEEVKNVAKQKADQIVDEAKSSAQKQVDELNSQVIMKQKELDDVKKQFDIYKAKMESLLISQLELIKDINKEDNPV